MGVLDGRDGWMDVGRRTGVGVFPARAVTAGEASNISLHFYCTVLYCTDEDDGIVAVEGNCIIRYPCGPIVVL